MVDEDVARYRRLLEARPDMLEMLCWTVVQPLTEPVTVAEVVRRLGGNADDIGLQPVVWELQDPPPVYLDQVGSAVVIAEPASWEGVREEVLRRLSDGVAVHSVAWADANGRGSVCYAAFGRLLTQLEYLDDDHPGGEQPTALDEDRAALREHDPELPVQLALVERRTGVGLDAGWLDRPHPAVVLRQPIPDDPRPPGLFASEDPDLACVLLMAGEPAHRAALHWVLSLLADEQDLRGEAWAAAVLDPLSHDWPTGEALRREPVAMGRRLQEEVYACPVGSPERDRLWRRSCACHAFASTVIDNPVRQRPPETLWYAQRALAPRWPPIRAELWRRAHQGRSRPPP